MTGAGWRRWFGIAGFVLVVAFVGLVVVDRRLGLLTPRPGLGEFRPHVLPIVVVAVLAGAVVATVRRLAGGLVVGLAAAASAPIAAEQLVPGSTVLVVAGPAAAAILWIAAGTASPGSEPVDPGRRRLLVAIGGTVVAAFGGAALGRLVHDRFWGPTHPESAVVPDSLSPLEWIWCGAVTSTSCSVRALAGRGFTQAQLLVATTPDLGDARRFPLDSSVGRLAAFEVDGLAADTGYVFAVELDGELDRVRTAAISTFPRDRSAVTIAFGSCARTGSNGAVFDTIRDVEPNAYVCLGDFHYADIDVDDVDAYREAFDVQLTRPAQAALYRSTPIAYVWDDHDYGPDNSDRTARSRAAAIVAYREYVPHYPLAGPVSSLHQAFSVGRVRVVLTDARSSRDPPGADVVGLRSMLGSTQRAWLLNELTQRSADHDVVIWVNPVPWIDAAEPGADTWAGYAGERMLIADHIADAGIDNLVMVSGDAHMVAIDDGTNTNFSSTPGDAFPLVHVAALDRRGSTKGGPYTAGPIPGGGHFGIVDIGYPGDGATVEVELATLDWRGDRLLVHRVTFPVAADSTAG